jgi:hypothetical protein
MLFFDSSNKYRYRYRRYFSNSISISVLAILFKSIVNNPGVNTFFPVQEVHRVAFLGHIAGPDAGSDISFTCEHSLSGRASVTLCLRLMSVNQTVDSQPPGWLSMVLLIYTRTDVTCKRNCEVDGRRQGTLPYKMLKLRRQCDSCRTMKRGKIADF